MYIDKKQILFSYKNVWCTYSLTFEVKISNKNYQNIFFTFIYMFEKTPWSISNTYFEVPIVLDFRVRFL